MRFNANAFYVASGKMFKVNGESDVNLADGYSENGVNVRINGDFVFLDYTGGISIKWDADDAWFITIHNDRFRSDKLKGLCGNNNGDAMGESSVLYTH